MKLCLLGIPMLLLPLLPGTVTGQHRLQRTEDAAVVGAIYSDQHIPDSVLELHRITGSLPVESRYKFLADWVLPSETHTTFRLAIDFTTTHPAPDTSADQSKVSPANQEHSARESAGGILISPALDLVETAVTLKRLDELRSRILRVESQDEVQQRCRLTMLGLVELAGGDEQKASTHFEELYARVVSKTYEDFEGRWPETLAVHVGLQHPRTREAVADMLYRMLQSQVRVGVAAGPEAWNRWVTATAGRVTGLRSLRNVEEAATPTPTRDFPWIPISKTTAWSRGQGLPCAEWRRQPGMVENLASHDEDYLVYRSPLRGNFEVECDVTSFNWRDTHLMIAGTYVAPVYDHGSYGVGSFRAARSAGKIEPRLSECDDWIRYRAVVRDGKCTTYFNGRLIHVESLSAEHDPWIAIRSAWYADGAARNLRIHGTPEIPEQIRLSANTDLSGWSAYFLETVGGASDHWRHSGDLAHGGEIVGRYEPGFHGLACERLLQYYRPMLENGTIEYEFYYREGETLVHPALDRRALILNPQGIQVHWITDGIFERSTLLAENLSDESEARRLAGPLPLANEAWNRLRVTLEGNTVTLLLNEHLVYQVELEPTNQRTFGLFYWSDRTKARVRNVVWKGDWPKALPPIDEQALAGKGTRVLDERIPQLAARFQHDFTRDGLPPERFLTEPKSAIHLVDSSENGVRVVVRAGKGYSPCWIRPRLRLEGDFDIRAEFESLRYSGTTYSSTGLYLQVVLEDSETTHGSVYRGRVSKPDSPVQIIAQAEFNRLKPSGNVMNWPGTTAEESMSGTLRLARRGDTLYCLFAEADSPDFRLIHTETVPRDAIRWDGLRLMNAIFCGTDGTCEVDVTWKKLSIWGEKIMQVPIQRGASAPRTTD